MKVIVKGKLPAIVVFALTSLGAQTKTTVSDPISGTIQWPTIAYAPPGTNVTPPLAVIGLVANMSDGTRINVKTGTWLTIQNGVLKVSFPLQYVDQVPILQPDKSWKYPKPGRNVKVWRNGLLQRRDRDYTLDSVLMLIKPMPITLGDGTIIPTWNDDDEILVDYIY